MNIQILDSWLRDYLNTKANPQKIAKYISLCGPTFDRVRPIKIGGKRDWVYDIEITSNRVDAMSVYGIAREASVILPQFRINANLQKIKISIPPKPKKSLPFKVITNKKLVYRTTAVIVGDIKNWESPDWVKDRLNAAGVRSLNSVVDITNYVMIELGQPMHVFDYNKIRNATIIIRESRRGEKITSFDDKTYSLPGGDIIFKSTDNKIIDLPGIIGTKNSVVDKNTKRFIFFVDNNNAAKIRKTSMSLGIRTVAATLNEKNVDPELGMTAILRALYLVKKICQGQILSKIYDNYPDPIKSKTVQTTHEFISNRLGIEISKIQTTKILDSLGFKPSWSGENLSVTVPSFRNFDVAIPEDIVEEIARIYGYHNLPSILLSGELPENYSGSFKFEEKIKNLLVNYGGIEVYTSSLVSKEKIKGKALKLKNPLGSDSEYLRNSLKHSLIDAAKQNKGEAKPFHLFEIANVYLPLKKELPEEKMILAGIFVNFSFRKSKGIIESAISDLGIKSTKLVKIRKMSNNNYYYEVEVNALRKLSGINSYVPLAKYPAQVEDISFVLPDKTESGDVYEKIKSVDSNVRKVELAKIYNNSYTFRIWYQSPIKTLNNQEVEKIRNKVTKAVESTFGAKVK